VLFLPEHGLWIADLVQLCGPWKARWCWQLPGTLRPELIETHPHKIVMRLGDEQFAVWAGSESIGAEIESAAEGNPAGWQSRGYGCVAPGHRVRLELACASEKLLVSYFGDQRLPAIVRVGGRSVVLSPDGQLQSFPASVVSDAPVVWHVRLRDGWKTFCQ
jgi:hypothetical protein